jgi:hypothetical protein
MTFSLLSPDVTCILAVIPALSLSLSLNHQYSHAAISADLVIHSLTPPEKKIGKLEK